MNPCDANQMCDLAADRCITNCAMGGDADDDSHPAIECGGDDCDDSDPSRYPGAPEVCDDRDTDCVDSTLAGPDDDLDGDGFVSTACCAADPSGGPEPVCGGDCDDSAAGVNPGSPEACNDIDDDCDGRVDEGLRSVFFRDDDGDLYGRDDDMIDACVRPDGYAVVGGDCDDTVLAINPLGTETCDGADQDCDEVIDEEAEELGTREHCSACFDECQFACGDAGCDVPVTIAAGHFHTCVSLESGTVYCWGDNGAGQLGIGSTLDRPRPTRVDLPNVTSVFAGGDYTIAHVDGPEIWHWGSNDDLQLADSGGDRLMPERRSTLIRQPDQTAAGSGHLCEMQPASVICRGRNTDGQVGTGTVSATANRTVITELSGALSIGAGSDSTCAVRDGGTVVCWGSNDQGQLGLGYFGGTIAEPADDTLELTGIVEVAVGSRFACARGSAGVVECWGDDDRGQLGIGYTLDRVSRPTIVTSLTAQDLSLGLSHACALSPGRRVSCWGYNVYGQVGGTGDPVVRPRLVPDLPLDIQSISVGGNHSCALSGDYVVYCWGSNSHGQLGAESVSVGARSNSPIMPTVP